MKLENKALIGLGIFLFFGILITGGVLIKGVKNDLKHVTVKDSLTLELEQTKVKYEKWKKDQAKKDSITSMKVDMGEQTESLDQSWDRITREHKRRLEEILKR